MILSYCSICRLSLVLVLLSLVSSSEGFSQDRPARIVIDSVEIPSDSTTFINRYGVTRDDYDVIQDQVTGIKWSAPIRRTMSDVRFGTREATIDLVGTTASYSRMLDSDRIRGRFLLEKDIQNYNNVAVIGGKLAQKLFGQRDPIGRNVRVGPDYYLIVGIVNAGARRDEFDSEPVPIRTETIINFDNTETTTSQVIPVEDPGESVFIPISTMKARNGDDAIVRAQGSFSASSFQISRIELVIENPRLTRASAQVIDQILKKNHPQHDYRIQLPR